MASLKNILPVALAVCLIQPGGAAYAQIAPSYSLSNIKIACASSSALCTAAVNTAIQQIKNAGLSPAQVNEQLGFLASDLVEIAQNASPEQKTLVEQYVSDALQKVAEASTDPEQTVEIIKVAEQVISGDSDSVDTSISIGSSPA